VGMMVAALDLRRGWCGGGCDDSEFEVLQGCGGEVLTLRCCIWRHRCEVGAVCDWFSSIRDSLTAYKSVEICR
ncbi:hypothetical protein A2U01_0076693, partial [Trifolium medium]|nr:hypothetical protein [Trifolium medium]